MLNSNNKEATVSLSRSDLIPMLAIMAGGAIGVFTFGAVAVSSPSHDVHAISLLDNDGSLRDGVTGTWVLSVDLGRAGSGNPRFVLEQEGTTITGTYSGAMGSRIAVTGTVENGVVKLFFPSREGVVAYEGRIEGITMTGTCVYGDMGEGTFKGRIRS